MSVPTNKDGEITTEDVVDFLQSNGHVGRENAIYVADIADRLRVRKRDITDFATRQLVKKAMEEELYPIGSCSNGYYIMSDGSEVDETVEDLNNRIAGMQQRKELIAQAWAYHKKNRLTAEDGGVNE